MIPQHVSVRQELAAGAGESLHTLADLEERADNSLFGQVGADLGEVNGSFGPSSKVSATALSSPPPRKGNGPSVWEPGERNAQ